MKRKKYTNEEYKLALYNHNHQLTLISPFISLDKKVKVLDNDGIEYIVQARSLLKYNHPVIFSAINKEDAFNKKLQKIHPDLKLVDKYIATHKKVSIIDSLGIIYSVKPESLMAGYYPSIQTAIDKEDAFCRKASNIHGNKYDYSKVIYKGNKIPVIIICRQHGEFKQRPNNHIDQKMGCPLCNMARGWTKQEWLDYTKNKNCTLYIIKCFSHSESFIKIGITSTNIYKRFQNNREMPYNYKILMLFNGNGNDVWDLEIFYLKQLKKYKIIPKLIFKGRQECFNLEALNELKNLRYENMYNLS